MNNLKVDLYKPDIRSKIGINIGFMNTGFGIAGPSVALIMFILLFAKVFGHPARVTILEHLFKINGCICGDLVNEIGLAQPTISQHLKELKQLGLIKGNVEGTSVCYCIHTENWAKMKRIFMEFLDQDTPQPVCC